MLGVRGLAALRNLPRLWRMLVRSKINPARTLFGLKTEAAAAA